MSTQRPSLIDSLRKTGNELSEALSVIPKEDFDRIPFEGSWTAGQVGEHIIKAVGSAILYGKVKPADREPSEKAGPIEALFLNNEIKMQSPDFILPDQTIHDKKEMIAELEWKINSIADAAGTLDLTLICEEITIPVFGQLTRLEWIRFFICHMQRHTYQLKNIAEQLQSTHKNTINKTTA